MSAKTKKKKKAQAQKNEKYVPPVRETPREETGPAEPVEAIAPAQPEQVQEAWAQGGEKTRGKGGKAKRQKMKRSTFIWFMIMLLAMIVIFAWRWIVVIRDGYFDAFVERGENTADAVDSMTGLDLSEAEAETLLPLQQEWDLYTSSRLRDEATITAGDGTTLHAYYYDEGSDLTVVVLHRFDLDGTDDFLPGSWLYEQTGCNFLLIDQRLHGGSGGRYFGFGYLEQNDLPLWLDWAEENLDSHTFLLWGEGTGANTMLYALSSGLLPEGVKGIVAESPYASMEETAKRDIWKFFTVPAFPFLNFIEMKLNDTPAGYTMKDLELGQALEESTGDIPVLFLESTLDEYILPEWTEEVYTAYQGPRDLISGGLSHGTVYAYAREEIQTLLLEGDYGLY